MYGAGVATAAEVLGNVAGATAESLGAITGGGIESNGSTCVGGTPWFDRSERFFGFVVDYRGTSPIVHVLLDGVAQRVRPPLDLGHRFAVLLSMLRHDCLLSLPTPGPRYPSSGPSPRSS